MGKLFSDLSVEIAEYYFHVVRRQFVCHWAVIIFHRNANVGYPKILCSLKTRQFFRELVRRCDVADEILRDNENYDANQ